MNYQALLLSKLEGVLAEIHYLKCKRYSSVSSKTALILLERYFIDQKQRISIYQKGPALMEFCVQIQAELEAYMPIIGLIANSANVRNLFEMYEPLWRIASRILEPDKTPKQANINLIVSSEWALSPFVFSMLPFSTILKDYILIGLPASESSNPLLVPLAGHELGHIAWNKFVSKREIQAIIQRRVSELINQDKKDIKTKSAKNNQLSLFEDPLYAETCALALRQAEESFCDFFGLRLFRQSYIYAFFYLLFPWRNFYPEEFYGYPPTGVRLEAFKLAAAQFKFEFPSEIEYAVESHSCETDQCKYLCAVRETITPVIIEEVNSITAIKKGQADFSGSDIEVNRIADKLRKIVPATEIKTLADIINAGWKIYFEKQAEVITDERFSITTLMDLIAKNFEVLAIEQRITDKRR